MSISQGGFDYEKEVIDNIREAGSTGVILEGAGNNHSRPDADFKVLNEIYNLEIKMNDGAQMGGTSVLYDQIVGFTLPENVPDELKPALLDVLYEQQENLEALLNFLYEYDSYVKAKRFPVTCLKDSWELAKSKGLLVNTSIPFTTEFIAQRYTEKNIHYIQIGEAGLFYLKHNPANLPVPKLEGDILVEIRTGRSGSRKTKGCNQKTVSGGIRVQGRLRTKQRSRYTFDKVSDIRFLTKIFPEKLVDLFDGNV